MMHRHVLIICDIEGSSCCTNYAATQFLGTGWPKACLGMSLDVDSVVKALFRAGAQKVYVKDFHRTGYNLFPEIIDPRAKLISGYRKGPVPGLGSPYDATGLIMLGMHSPSGSNGFLPHTLTSRIERLEVNGSLLSEAELFAAVLAPYHIAPLFLSGCPSACRYASRKIPGINTFPVNKEISLSQNQVKAWRRTLSERAVSSLSDPASSPFQPMGPFKTAVTMAGNRRTAATIARRWGHRHRACTIHFSTDTVDNLFLELIKLAYLTPAALALLPIGLALYDIIGRTGLKWAGRQVKSLRPADDIY